MTTRRESSGQARIAAVHVGAVLAGGAVLLVGFGWSMLHGMPSSLLAPATSPLPVGNVPSAPEIMAAAGLTPEALTAAGASSNEVAAVATAVKAFAVEHGADLGTANESVLSAQARTDRLERLVQSGLASEPDLQALATAKADLATAQASRSSLRNAAFAAACAAIGEQKAALLAQIRSNAACGVPMQYRTVARSEQDWHALKRALASSNTAARCGQDADAACTALIASANAEQSTVAAAENLSQRLHENGVAWRQATASAE